MHLAIAVLTLVFSFFALLPVQAQVPLWPDTDRAALAKRIASGEAAQVLAELSAQAQVHLHDPEFNYWLGLAALNTDKKPLAMDSFERAVLINPKHAGAWLELALLHAQFGDEQTALRIFDHVLTQFDPPSDVRQKIDAFKREMASRKRTQFLSIWQAEVHAGIGYASNVNAGLNNLNFLLYLPDASPVLVRANDALKARSDTALMLRAIAARTQTIDADYATETIVTLGARHYTSERDYRQADLGLWWQVQRRLNANSDWRIRPGIRLAQQDAQTEVAVASLLAGFGWQLTATCQSMVFAEPELRRVSGIGVGSQTLWVGAQSACRTGFGQIGGYVRLGSDRPDGARAGGTTERAEAQVSFRRSLAPWSPLYEVEASVFGARYADREVYSSLLGENSKRIVERWVARVGLERQLEGIPRTKVSVYYLNTQDKSGISLFSTQGEEVFVGLKRQFDF